MNTSKLNVLVGIDFSESSTLALSHALQLATQLGARLHLGYIAYSGPFIVDTSLGLNIPDDFPDAQKGQAKLQQLKDQLAASVDVMIHIRLSMSVLEGFLGLIMEIKPDFVVVGSHGKGILKRAFLGSVSGELARRSPVPVMIVPSPGLEQLLDQPVPTPEPELPAVGHAVTNSDGATGAYGIAGVGGGDVLFR